MPSGLTFQGLDSVSNVVLYKGLTGKEYSFSVKIPAVLKVSHGSTLQATEPSAKGRSGYYTVIGCSNVSTENSTCDLWIHEHGASSATLVKDLSSADQLFSQYAPVDYPPDSTPFLGPFGVSYFFHTSPRVLAATFGVTQDERYYLKSLGTNVRVVGELFGILWVAKADAPNVAVPLPGCVNEDSLHGLYGLCDPTTGPSPSHSQLVSTPRRATNTPRRAATDSNGRSSVIVVDATNHTATCPGPLGVRLRCDISAEALKSFGVIQNQKLVSRVGLDAGRFCHVVGVSNGTLYVLFEGDGRATCVRNCDSAATLKTQFSTGDAKEKGPTASTATPQKPSALKPVAKSTVATVASPVTDDGLMSPSSPRLGDKIKKFWTTFGRLEFDTSDFSTSPFGFHHGQVVRGGNGLAKDKMYTVIGARLGNLWVLEEGKYRATALVHCSDAKQIAAMYKLVATGTVKDLRPYYEAADEPPATPMHTPRFRLSSSSPHRDTNDSSFSSPSRNISGIVGVDQPSTKSPPIIAPPTSSALPPLSFATVPRDSAPLPTVVTSASSGYQQKAPVVAAPKPTPSTLTSSTSAPAPAVPSPSTLALAQPSAREYLKAWALYKMGQRTQDGHTLSFHHYYMTDTVKRISEAFARLPRAKQVWSEERREPAFYGASTQELLRFLHERPSISAY